MIKFNEQFYTGNELTYIKEMMTTKNLQGVSRDDDSVKRLRDNMKAKKLYFVHSCTAALEIAALALDIEEGDEVIMPSFTFVSTANAFALRGAKIIFVDVDEETMNIDLIQVEQAITSKTRVLVPVHYGGVSCDMDRLTVLANKHNLVVVEDAAQGIYSKYKGRHLGTLGHLGCISLHETKNITSGGEGGILVVNDETLIKKIDIIVEKGTNRSEFLNGEVKKYTWQAIGSSYLMSQLGVAFFTAQYEYASEITNIRTNIFYEYMKGLSKLINNNKISILEIPTYNEANGHMFYIKTKDESERNQLTTFLKNKGIETTSHYEPLHTSVAGKMYGEFIGKDSVTSRDSKRLLRLPLHMHLSSENIEEVIVRIKEFYESQI